MVPYSKFGELISARTFQRTRILPPRYVRRLFGAAFAEMHRHGETIRDALDIGCGTGRMLSGLAASQPNMNIVGIDISETMLAAAADLDLPSHCRLRVGDCRRKDTIASDCADMIILHWVLNTTEGWDDILARAIEGLRGGGSILWFDERSNLYDAIDGRLDSGPFGRWPPLALKFWNTWYDGLGEYRIAGRLQNRIGLSMNDVKAECLLTANEFNVTRLKKATEHWVATVSLRWLFHNVLEKKAFSNLWLIPDRQYERALNAVRNFFMITEGATDTWIDLSFSSTPVIAHQGNSR